MKVALQISSPLSNMATYSRHNPKTSVEAIAVQLR